MSLVKKFYINYIITVLIKKELKNVVFLHNNFTTEEFQTASARKRQINADNAAVDGIFPCLQSTGMYSVCMRYWYWRTTGGVFQSTSFFFVFKINAMVKNKIFQQ